MKLITALLLILCLTIAGCGNPVLTGQPAVITPAAHAAQVKRFGQAELAATGAIVVVDALVKEKLIPAKYFHTIAVLNRQLINDFRAARDAIAAGRPESDALIDAAIAALNTFQLERGKAESDVGSTHSGGTTLPSVTPNVAGPASGPTG